MAKICIVTPDIIGPITNGGIGTACYFLAWALVQAKHDVQILFTGNAQRENENHWKQWYANKHITFDCLKYDVVNIAPIHASPSEITSFCVYEQLKDSSYDQIYFQDWQGHGFHCFQAKRTYGHFANTHLILTLHSSTEWASSGMEQWADHPVHYARIDYCERYCARHADIVISPSLHMLDWVRSAGWQLTDDTRHMPNILLNDAGKPQYTPAYIPSSGVMAFFGRLETRKGLHLFCKALIRLPEASRNKIKQILFIGKSWMCEGKMGVEYIRDMLTPLGIPFEIHADLDSFQAQNMLREHKALAFCPSLLDNLPYTIVECACRGIPVMAADIGGIPEILSPQHCFSATVIGLSQCIEQILEQGYQPAKPLYNPHLAEKLWLELATEKFLPQPEASSIVDPCPKISVCIPHYNHGSYLPNLLKALAASDYPDFEVIITDDGSTDSFSKQVFAQLIAETQDKRFHFYHKKNEGLSICRNFCASKAKGEFLVFMDSDNIPTPQMLHTFGYALNRGNLDALTCHYLGFPQEHTGAGEPKQFIYRYAPPGPDIMMGIIQNVFGDANMIIRKQIFDKLKGFTPTKEGETFEDWEFLARLSLAGYKQDVIPEVLFWYRHVHNSLARTCSQYKCKQLLLSAYRKYLNPFTMQIIQNLIIPLYMTTPGMDVCTPIATYHEDNCPSSPLPSAAEIPAFKVLRYNKLTRLLRLIAPGYIDAYLLEHCNAFDQTFYLRANPDVALQGINPALHYIKYGAKEGRDPASWFSTRNYLNANPDVKESGQNPLMHFLISGFKEGRKTS